MRIEEVIYFSPCHKMESLDFSNREMIIDAFAERIKAFYFNPIHLLNNQNNINFNENTVGYAFAAGNILFALVDAIAKYSSLKKTVGERIKEWLELNINGVDASIAKKLYDNYRNGLIHEARVKNNGQFSYEISYSVFSVSGIMVVNPIIFLSEVEEAFSNFIVQLQTDDDLFKIFHQRLKADFEAEANSLLSI